MAIAAIAVKSGVTIGNKLIEFWVEMSNVNPHPQIQEVRGAIRVDNTE